jgi:predicted DCC family thiol-disulfide oxidoreductase YuxK
VQKQHTLKQPECSHNLFYDGVCGLCNRLVGFVLKRDRRKLFCFASLQSSFACETLSLPADSPIDFDTLVVIAYYQTGSEKYLSRSEAVLFVLQELGGLWRWARIFAVVPTFLLDTGYRFVARTRYRFFGKYDSCPLPDQDYQSRFIEV